LNDSTPILLLAVSSWPEPELKRAEEEGQATEPHD
jgi:hypothetical protein